MTDLLEQIPAFLRKAFEEALFEKDAHANALIASREAQIATKEAEKHRLEIENRLLREEIRRMRLEKYGPGSEKLTDAQLELLECEPGVSSAEVAREGERTPEEKQMVMGLFRKPSQPRPHPGREELPAHLPRQEVIIACTEEECRCGQCGREKKVIGYEQSEELDVEPAKFFVRVTRREKRACAHCEEEGVSTAPVPPKIIEKGKAGDALAVSVAVKKYGDHEPLYRQCAEIERETGLKLSRSTLCGWVMQIGFLLGCIGLAMKRDLLDGGYIQADETPVMVQTAEKTGKNHQAYLWQYSRPGGPVVFDFQMGRSRAGPKGWLGEFDGVLQCDGYGAYDQIGGPAITYAGCMAHVRRKFFEAWKVSKSEEAAGILVVIGKLYKVEQEAREAGLNHAGRLALRQDKSTGIMEELRRLMETAQRKGLPQSLQGKACEYALGQWRRLGVYLQDGRVEIDNNLCENAVRPVAIGRKNWLHIGSEESGPRVAAIISIFETCRRLDVNVRDYLLSVLPVLRQWPVSRVHELTPAAWKASGCKLPPL